jgi:hypothetical protein
MHARGLQLGSFAALLWLWDALVAFSFPFSCLRCVLVACATTYASVMDVLAQLTIKDAAKCDTHCELQISENKLKSECISSFGICLKVGLTHVF